MILTENRMSTEKNNELLENDIRHLKRRVLNKTFYSNRYKNIVP